MNSVNTGDRARVDIPNKDDPDFDQYHRRIGTVIEILSNDAGEMTGDGRDRVLYRVEFESGDRQDFRWRDLRPAPGNDR